MVKANHTLSNSAQGVKFSRQVSRRKIYDVIFVHTSLHFVNTTSILRREIDYRSVYFEGRP